MNWALFGAIWSFEMVAVFGYLAASGKLFLDKSKTDESRSYSSTRAHARSAQTSWPQTHLS